MTRISVGDRYEFDDNTHTHYIDGRSCPGVSSVSSCLAKPALIPWAAKEAVNYIKENAAKVDNDNLYYEATEEILAAAAKAYARKRDKAASHGTDFHVLVESYVGDCIQATGKPGTPPVEEYKAIQPFIDWSIANVEKFLFTERNVYDPALFLAGIADFGFIGKDGRKFIADFKTSSGVYGIDYYLQCAGYRVLAEAMGDEPYDGGYIVRMGKDGSFETLERSGPLWEQDRACFLHALALYKAQKQWELTNKKP